MEKELRISHLVLKLVGFLSDAAANGVQLEADSCGLFLQHSICLLHHTADDV